jgi:hypothetical protein
VCYESKKLKEHERHYDIHDLELETIVHALNMWRHYLMGKIFDLRTDHSGLKYLFGQPTLNARQRKQLEFLGEYDVDIKNIKGKESKVADALDRRVHDMHATTISKYQSDLKDKILEVAKSNLPYMEIKTKLQQGILQKKSEEYKLEKDEILMFRCIIYVPNS